MPEPSPPCKLHDEVGFWFRLAYPGVTLFWPAQNFCAEGFAQEMENQETGCAGGLHMGLVCLWWANKSKDWLSMGLQTSSTAPKLTTTQP